jgi:hypothetical protein
MSADVMELRPVVAVVLDLFDAPEREVRAWRPTVYSWSLCGESLGLSDDAARQWRLMRPDTLVPAALRAATPPGR